MSPEIYHFGLVIVVLFEISKGIASTLSQSIVWRWDPSMPTQHYRLKTILKHMAQHRDHF